MGKTLLKGKGDGTGKAVFTCILVWASVLTTLAVWAQDDGASVQDKKNGSPIHITSDRVISDQKAKWIEFIGNVRATQDNAVITSDSMKIFYKAGAGEDSDGVGSQAVEKMWAQGNVKILFDDQKKTASADSALYTVNDKILVLSGGNPMVQSGQDVIRGEKITLYQAENRAEVEGGQKKQVEATFYSQGEGGLIK